MKKEFDIVRTEIKKENELYIHFQVAKGLTKIKVATELRTQLLYTEESECAEDLFEVTREFDVFSDVTEEMKKEASKYSFQYSEIKGDFKDSQRFTYTIGCEESEFVATLGEFGGVKVGVIDSTLKKQIEIKNNNKLADIEAKKIAESKKIKTESSFDSMSLEHQNLLLNQFNEFKTGTIKGGDYYTANIAISKIKTIKIIGSCVNGESKIGTEVQFISHKDNILVFFGTKDDLSKVVKSQDWTWLMRSISNRKHILDSYNAFNLSKRQLTK